MMALLLALFLIPFCPAATGFMPDKYTLTIVVCEIHEVTGNIEVALYNKKENFPKDNMEYLSKTVPVKSNRVECGFYVPEGYYAIALFHDANNNKIFDKNFWGVPTEGFGFSNNVKPGFHPPSFESCKILLNKNLHLCIHLIHY
ncbi:MAG: DUF2141 domain-containing protein [Bacteroidales bacterium]|nr:DUF2141 domain-containing protein [Bacteroidales bacterium]